MSASTRRNRSTRVVSRTRTAEAGLAQEVRRVDHQRVAVPASARVSRVLREPDVGTAVERDDARVVHHLVHNHDVVRRLQDQHVVVVRAGHHRRTGVEPQETPVGQAAVGVGVGESVSDVGRPDPRLGLKRLAVGDATVRGVHDQRRALVPGQLDAAFVPELVVAADAALRERLIAHARCADGEILRVAVQLPAPRRLVLGRLLCRERLPAREEGGRAGIDDRTLKRGQRPEREQPLDVGIAVRGARRGLPHRRCGQRDADEGQERVAGSVAHRRILPARGPGAGGIRGASSTPRRCSTDGAALTPRIRRPARSPRSWRRRPKPYAAA